VFISYSCYFVNRVIFTVCLFVKKCLSKSVSKSVCQKVFVKKCLSKSVCQKCLSKIMVDVDLSFVLRYFAFANEMCISD